jgi:hypothetical protein
MEGNYTVPEEPSEIGCWHAQRVPDSLKVQQYGPGGGRTEEEVRT